MRITAVEPLILHMPLNRSSIADSTHRITHWGVVGVRLVTDDGREGYGFTGTHADLASDRLIAACIGNCYAPLLAGRGRERRPPPVAQARPRTGAAMGRTRRHHAAGARRRRRGAVGPARQGRRRPAVAPSRRRRARTRRGLQHRRRLAVDPRRRSWSTAAGAPSRSTASAASRSRSATTTRASTSSRLEAVRRAIGAGVTLAIDGNGKWDLPTCQRFCARAEAFDIFWFEEPLWYDDVAGARGAGAQHVDPDRAGRAALHGRRLRRLHGRRRGPLRAARRHAPRRRHRVPAGRRRRARAPAAGRRARRRDEPGPRPPVVRAPGGHGARVHPVDHGQLRRADPRRGRLLRAPAGAGGGDATPTARRAPALRRCPLA